MSEARTAKFHSVAEETSRVMGLSMAHDKVRPVLAAYGHVMAPAVISFRTQTGPRGADDLDCRWTMLPKDLDPYAVALSNGFATETGHPVDRVSREIHQAFPVGGYGFDFGVVGGFKKTWTFFPAPAPQPVARLAELPSMPRSVTGNLAFFERHGVAGIVNTVGIDYPKRTVNLYFNPSSPEVFRPKGLRALLSEAGLPEPSEALTRFCEQAFSVYTTLNWESSTIERITFSVRTTDPLGLPVKAGEGIEKLVRHAPYPAGDQYVYGVSVTPLGEFHKIQSYYQWHARVESMLSAVDAG
ncbi:aromatic prenyltransferase [Streptomyces qinzhouensis]|uniref:Prenyltransferase n=1 Tax=Streptomyces qinzhouensis TaxID=2599401 RepID=A0A5B8IPQ6_9ACTN|nr:aromatic prenyltransferase [Streptomyces qinzhouensis]QDY75170.1 prenyltransferase [Streptomyces qinzhouensis]QDY80628.1 prenyltransferase [Streptomyces qinzhouensis]